MQLQRPRTSKTMTKPTVLVTGATGFLGRHVLTALGVLRPDLRPLALVRHPAEWQRMDWTKDFPDVQVIQGSVTDDQGWTNTPQLQGLVGIFHLAAVVQHSRRNTQHVYDTNIGGTLRMVRLAAKTRCRLVFVSTSGTVGCFTNPRDQADEDAPYCDKLARRWPYYDSKIKAERQARALAVELGVAMTVIRPPVLLGPGDHKFRSSGNVLKFLRHKLPFVLSGGMNFTDIRDAATAIVRAIDHPAGRPIYHLPGTETSVGDFFQLCQQVSGVIAPTRVLPTRAAHALASAAARATALWPGAHSPLPDPVVIEMGSRWWGLKSRYAAKELGYQPRPARQTLADTIEWLRHNHPDLLRELALKGPGI